MVGASSLDATNACRDILDDASDDHEFLGPNYSSDVEVDQQILALEKVRSKDRLVCLV